MRSFLEEVVHKVLQGNTMLEDVVFVLPSKRAGTFLRNAIAVATKETSFGPQIYSIEGFVEKISGLAYVSNTQQLFELYSCYLKGKTAKKDDFFSFSKWGQTLLQDFNEIDRHLVDAEKLFSNLSAIQEINHWSLQEEKTPMMENYLKFWNNLHQLYTDFNSVLLNQGLGGQGFVYKKACDQLPSYIDNNPNITHVFVGFNALNTAESVIIQTLLEKTAAKIYWDIDAYFLNDVVHDASLFIRKHKNSWPYFKDKGLAGVGTNFSDDKHIHITGVPKNVSQAKYIGKLLKQLGSEQPELIKNTALVLADESLLNPVLNAVPEEIAAVNITMGYPLDKTPLASLFTDFMALYLYRDSRGWFYQNMLSFLSHSYVNEFLQYGDDDDGKKLLAAIRQNNWTHVTMDRITAVCPDNPFVALLFFNDDVRPVPFVERCLAIIQVLKDRFQEAQNELALEYLYRFHSLFNQILELLQKHSFITDLKSLQSLYKELLSAETIDFRGDPLQGLQIMGMLESRNLDFETVIITSVNEGILPSGKSNNSFIPFDLKIALGLPTYKEKDAIYTYHFYRLLQRAKHIHIVYNTEPDVLEGREKSRLIAQLLTDPHTADKITATVVAPTVKPIVQSLTSIEKDEGLMALIRAHATKGFSPTSLSNYIRNPIDFYKRNLLGIDNTLEVEENIAANTFGTIVHDTLEDLYTPFVGKTLSKELLLDAKAKIESLVQKHFAKSYMDGDISQGKNFIAYHVILRYIQNYIDAEIIEVQRHEIKILGLEEKMQISLKFPELDFPVVLKGKLDRIDTKDGIVRIIDYKTGKVESKHVEIVDWLELTTDYAYSKAFQLLCYALMYSGANEIDTITSGIVSFKNQKAGLLKFATKEKKGSRNKDYRITEETLALFQEELKRLILEICNAQIPLVEKEV